MKKYLTTTNIILVLSVIASVISTALQQQVIPLKYVAYAGYAVTVITSIIKVIQNQTLSTQVTTLKAENATLKTQR